MSALPQHSAVTPEHYTPASVIEAARWVMGGIDLDPATTAEVNRTTVLAPTFFTREDDGLERRWHGRVWLNPPGGVVRGRSNAAIWWKRLAADYLAGSIDQALFLGFSIEILATAQDAEIWPGEMPFCVPRQRIEFLRAREPGGAPGMRSLFGEPSSIFAAGESPTHANVIVYLPPWKRGATVRGDAVERFVSRFGELGKVRA